MATWVAWDRWLRDARHGPVTATTVALALALALARPRGMIGRVLATRPAVFLGEVGFAIDMLHQVLLKFPEGRLPPWAAPAAGRGRARVETR